MQAHTRWTGSFPQASWQGSKFEGSEVFGGPGPSQRLFTAPEGKSHKEERKQPYTLYHGQQSSVLKVSQSTKRTAPLR